MVRDVVAHLWPAAYRLEEEEEVEEQDDLFVNRNRPIQSDSEND
jgi:hypothetical protein